MLPRRKRVILKGSEVEEYKNKSLIGHWVLVKDSDKDLRNEINKYSTEDSKDRGAAIFAARNVTVQPCPSDRFLDVSGRGFTHMDGELFVGDPFDRIHTINADNNLLRLATFRTFKSVRRLSLRQNRLQSVEPVDGDLAETLIRLDVSKNRLNPDDIYSLSASKLEQLYISDNNLAVIPESITDYRCFLSLELLDLSDNCLSCPKTFYILSTLHSLRELNMTGNLVSFIPYLVTKQEFENNESMNKKETTITDNKEDGNEFVYHVQHIPFVSLNIINLSNNNIAQGSSVLSLICWPSLSNVILTANTISLKKNLSAFERLKSTLKVYNIKIER